MILLILAGISISQLTGSGLFENAKLAEEKSKNAQEKEDSILGDYENKIGQYLEGGRTIAESELISDVKPKIDNVGATILTISVDAIAQNNNDIFGFIILLNGEVKEWFKKEQEESYTISNLQPNTEYRVSIIAVDKYGNIKKSNEEKYKTLDGFEYAVITSTGIYNLKKNNEYVLIFNAGTPYASDALTTEAYDNDASTVIYGTIDESVGRYLNVDSSAIGTKMQATFGCTTSSYVFGGVSAVMEDGTLVSLANGYNYTATFTIPEGCKRIVVGMQRNCWLSEIKVVE